MRNTAKYVLLTSSLVMAVLMTHEAEAKTLAFPNTPVQSMTVEGSWNPIEPDKIDKGKGIAFNSAESPDQLGVIAIDAAIPESTKKVLSGKAGVLTNEQLRELGKSENPWILRYCAERGKSELTKIGNRVFLTTDFWQSQMIRVATSNGSQCLDAGKYESHAFALNGNKLVHIYLIRNVRGDQDLALSAELARRFRTMLTSMKWH